MRGGQCFPVTNILTDELYCRWGFESAILLAATLNVTGSFADIDMLNERDTSLIEKEIEQLFPVDIKVVVSAVEHSTANSFLVELKAIIIAEQFGYKGNYDEDVDALMTELPTFFNKFLDNGLFATKLIDDLDKMTHSENDPLRYVEKISLINIKFIDIQFQDPHLGVAFAYPLDIIGSKKVEIISSYIPPTKSQSLYNELSGSFDMLSLVAVAGTILLILVVVRNSNVFSQQTLLQSRRIVEPPLRFKHSSLQHNVEGELNGDDVLITERLQEEVLKSEIKVEHRKAIHYKDDLDRYNKYLYKKTFV
jgi:hypothetical protein